MSLFHEVLGEPAAPRSVWFLHGILGQGRNWRSFARRLLDGAPGWRAVLPDLRCHGRSPALPPPHDLGACAADLSELADRLGPPDVVVGHSFGGKVALRWAPGEAVLWVLDSPPGASPDRDVEGLDPERIIGILRGAPAPAPDRDTLRSWLSQHGLPDGIVAWLLTSSERGDDGWRWMWDLDGVEALLQSYLQADLWPVVERLGDRVQLVRAGRGGRWSASEVARAEASGAGWHVMPQAGHWLHVDDPEGTLALIRRHVR